MQKVPAILAVGLIAALTLGTSLAQAETALTVCAGADGLLRLLEKSGPCKPGETKKLFAEWEPEEPEAPEDNETDELQTKVARLSKRLEALESAKKESDEPTRVVAPFEVVAADGSVILRVSDQNGSKTDTARVTIGAGPRGKDHYGVRVYQSGGGIVAGLGQGSDGTSIVYTMERPGGSIGAMLAGSVVQVLANDVVKASVLAEPNGGTIAVVEGTTAVASLSRSSGGDGGNVTLRLNNSFGVFSAGAAQDGGGEACVNRVTGGGDPRRACLGIELPSMGLGK